MRHMNWPWLEESLQRKSFLEAAMWLVSIRLFLAAEISENLSRWASIHD